MKIKNCILSVALILGSSCLAAVPADVQPAAKAEQVKEAKSKYSRFKKAIKCAWSGKGCTGKERAKIVAAGVGILAATLVLAKSAHGWWVRPARAAAEEEARSVASAGPAAGVGGEGRRTEQESIELSPEEQERADLVNQIDVLYRSTLPIRNRFGLVTLWERVLLDRIAAARGLEKGRAYTFDIEHAVDEINNIYFPMVDVESALGRPGANFGDLLAQLRGFGAQLSANHPILEGEFQGATGQVEKNIQEGKVAAEIIRSFDYALRALKRMVDGAYRSWTPGSGFSPYQERY